MDIRYPRIYEELPCTADGLHFEVLGSAELVVTGQAAALHGFRIDAASSVSGHPVWEALPEADRRGITAELRSALLHKASLILAQETQENADGSHFPRSDRRARLGLRRTGGQGGADQGDGRGRSDAR